MAKYYLLTGDLMTADEAKELGLVTFAVDPEELDACCQKIAGKLSAGAPLAIKWTKSALNVALQQKMPAVFEMSLACSGRADCHVKGLCRSPCGVPREAEAGLQG